MASTAFNFFAIPHLIKLLARTSAVAVLISEKGIRWNQNNVNIVLLSAITDIDKQFIEVIYAVIYPIFCENKIIHSIKEFNIFENFQKFILNS